jgi:hypothetical protein
LKGEFAAQVGDHKFHEGPGARVFAPKGVPHTYWNPGTAPATYLELGWPAGLDRYLEDLGSIVARGGEDMLAEVIGLSGRYGIQMDWESLDALMTRHGVGFAM